MAMLLTALQARIVGVLVEKQHTVPDTYPLSLNALVAGCNQKSARDPVMETTEAEVRAALDELRQRLLVIESSGARVTRYEHNLGRALKIPAQAEALLATLLLRGARIASERLHRFADTGSVEVFLEELAARPADRGGALALKLPRRPGEREARWAHLLCGAPPVGVAAADAVPAAQPAGLAADVAALRAEVEALRAEVAALRARLPDQAGA
jgi:uncharacterized protein YceH (UPF0502 family)